MLASTTKSKFVGLPRSGHAREPAAFSEAAARQLAKTIAHSIRQARGTGCFLDSRTVMVRWAIYSRPLTTKTSSTMSTKPNPPLGK
jgi:hypothetical protein